MVSYWIHFPRGKNVNQQCAKVPVTLSRYITLSATGWRGSPASMTCPLWARTAKNTDWSTGPLARPFARSLALLTRALAHFAYSRARGKVNDWMAILSGFFSILDQSVTQRFSSSFLIFKLPFKITTTTPTFSYFPLYLFHSPFRAHIYFEMFAKSVKLVSSFYRQSFIKARFKRCRELKGKDQRGLRMISDLTNSVVTNLVRDLRTKRRIGLISILLTFSVK